MGLPRLGNGAGDEQRRGKGDGDDGALRLTVDVSEGPQEGYYEVWLRDEQAKQVCMTCPVLQQCRAHALKVREPYGVWGGFSESERLRLLAMGWEDCADRRQSRVDIARLEARLGRAHKSTVPSQRNVA